MGKRYTRHGRSIFQSDVFWISVGTAATLLVTIAIVAATSTETPFS